MPQRLRQRKWKSIWRTLARLIWLQQTNMCTAVHIHFQRSNQAPCSDRNTLTKEILLLFMFSWWIKIFVIKLMVLLFCFPTLLRRKKINQTVFNLSLKAGDEWRHKKQHAPPSSRHSIIQKSFNFIPIDDALEARETKITWQIPSPYLFCHFGASGRFICVKYTEPVS
jgi:hypothetical protein